MRFQDSELLLQLEHPRFQLPLDGLRMLGVLFSLQARLLQPLLQFGPLLFMVLLGLFEGVLQLRKLALQEVLVLDQLPHARESVCHFSRVARQLLLILQMPLLRRRLELQALTFQPRNAISQTRIFALQLGLFILVRTYLLLQGVNAAFPIGYLRLQLVNGLGCLSACCPGLPLVVAEFSRQIIKLACLNRQLHLQLSSRSTFQDELLSEGMLISCIDLPLQNV